MSRSNKEVNDQVAPVTLRLLKFSKMVTGETWNSSPFFAFIGGYQVHLKVVRVKDCLMSLELFLMKGPHDEELKKLRLWPMKGTFAVKLFGNNKYYPHIYTPPDEERCTKCYEQLTADDPCTDFLEMNFLDTTCFKTA